MGSPRSGGQFSTFPGSSEINRNGGVRAICPVVACEFMRMLFTGQLFSSPRANLCSVCVSVYCVLYIWL